MNLKIQKIPNIVEPDISTNFKFENR